MKYAIMFAFLIHFGFRRNDTTESH